jgi:nucleotide-binding universal stress UspA family protein
LEQSIVTHLSRVLVAVDSSEPARAAFDRALAIARVRGAELLVVHAVPATQPFNLRARERIALVAKLREAAEGAGVRFAVSVQQGDPAGVIVLHAESRRPDLIVLGTHQRAGLDRLRAGSVAERVVARAEQPVLIVPAGHAATTDRAFSGIVAAVDFSEASARALERARALAREIGAELTVVHVIPGTPEVPPYLYRYGAVEYRTLQAHDAERQLQALVPEAGVPGGRVRIRVVSGAPDEEITRIATESGADLIVLGVPRRGIVGRAVFGTTASRVARIAAQPILAVPENAAAASPAADRQPRVA